MIRPPPISTLFPYTTLFRSDGHELTAEARARLAALADHTELGAGFSIAMRDLEIRGAGDLLGAEQPGHVAAVGFELDRKSTRLNSSHANNSYAFFWLKKKLQ